MSNRSESSHAKPADDGSPGLVPPAPKVDASVILRLEEAMAACERRFSFLAALPQVAAYASDTAADPVLMNARAAKLLGENPGERKTLTCQGIVLLYADGREVPHDECPVTRALAQRRPTFSDDILLRRPDGSVTRVSCQAEPVLDDEGRVIGAVNALLEIDEHLLTTRREQQQARMIQQAGKAAICTDPQGNVTFWNNAATEIFGWTSDQAIGRNVSEIIEPQLTTEQWQEMEAKLHVGESWDGQFKAKRKDGRIFTASITASPILDDDGNLVGIVGLGNDVDVATRAAEALRESEERYHALFSSMSEGVALGEMLYDEDGNAFNYRCLDVNPAGEKCLGLPRSAMLGRTMRDYVQNPNALALQRLAEVVSTGEPTRFEFFSEHLGKRFSVTAFRPAEHQFAVILQDVTDQHRTLDALRASESRFRSLYGAISGGVVVQDRDGKIVEANAAACEVLGVSLEQMLGLTAYDPRWHAVKEDGTRATPDEHPSVITRKTGQPVHGVEMGVFNATENAYRWMIVNSQPVLQGGSGRLEAVVITFVDITPRKRAQEALHRSREQFEIFMDNLPGHAWIKDLQGRYLYLNDAAVKTITENSDWRGKTASELWDPEIAEKFDEWDRDVIENGVVVQVTDAIESGGRSGHLVSQFPIIRANEDESVICGIAIDATGIQRTMEQLRSRQAQLADANRRLEEEISKISEEERRRLGQDLHDDICQNLVGVSLLCGELAASLAASDPTDADLASRVEGMICDAIKDIKSLARGLHPVTLERQGLLPALRELADRITTTKVPCRFEPLCGPVSKTHPAALSLYRIAQEALANSLKHAEATELSISLNKEGDNLVLRVADNGIGIGRSNPQGMGLHIMDYRARSIGGTLKLDRSRDGGTIVICRVPDEE